MSDHLVMPEKAHHVIVGHVNHKVLDVSTNTLYCGCTQKICSCMVCHRLPECLVTPTTGHQSSTRPHQPHTVPMANLSIDA